ncbi:hypothetical protein [Deinococcus marmoris]|nr:hypothetical protein [Deinococcus marmoris]
MNKNTRTVLLTLAATAVVPLVGYAFAQTTPAWIALTQTRTA